MAMINRATVSKAIVALLQDKLPPTTDNGEGYTVERADFAETNPDAAPWIGVYRDGVKYDPATLGDGARNLHAEALFRIIVMASSPVGGADCEDQLMEYEVDVLTALRTDCTLGGTVDMVTGLGVDDSFDEFVADSLHVQFAIITLTAETRSG